jgi:uncharacterized protein (TIGR02145 family)
MGSSTESTRQVAQPSFWFSVRCLQGLSQVKSSSSFSSSSVSSSSSKGCTAADNTETHFCDTRDGHLYRYITINLYIDPAIIIIPDSTIFRQTWMAENLNYDVEGSNCYGNDPENCRKYGRLYDWATSMGLTSYCNRNDYYYYNSLCLNKIGEKHQGICPSGWHIPNFQEWLTLVDFAGGNKIAGKKLKAASGWNDYNGVSGNGTDDYGFSALPGGSYVILGAGLGSVGYWWSATTSNKDNAFRCDMHSNSSISIGGVDAGANSTDRDIPISVRCVKD